MRDPVPRPGIEPGPSALGAQSLTHCTTREVPHFISEFSNLGAFFFVHLVLKKISCLFFWLHWVLVAAHMVFVVAHGSLVPQPSSPALEDGFFSFLIN